jgi:hypothetical protein
MRRTENRGPGAQQEIKKIGKESPTAEFAELAQDEIVGDGKSDGILGRG